MPTRRDFLHAAGWTTLAASLPRGTLFRNTADRLDRIGIQLYTTRSVMQGNVEPTLARLARIGYREVEFAGYYDHSPAEIKAMLGRTGLSAPSSHMGFPELGDGWKRTLDTAAEIGHTYVVTAWIDEPRRTPDGYHKVIDIFNRAGEAAKARGLVFAYHNHDFEFTRVGDRPAYDLLLDGTDPALVKFEMDLYWIIHGGADPLDYFRRYPGRFHLVHVKDMNPDRSMADVGSGTIDFPKIFSHHAQAGIRHYYVERDDPTDPFETARKSFTYLRQLEF